MAQDAGANSGFENGGDCSPTTLAFDGIRTLHGDCLDVLPTLADRSVDLVLCDLPYGTTKCPWDILIPLDVLWRHYRRLLRPGGAVILTAVQPFTSVLVASNLADFKHEWIWQKSKSGSAFTARSRPLAKHESVLVFGRGRVSYHPQMEPGVPYRRVRATGAVNNHALGLHRRVSVTESDGWRYPGSVQPFQQRWRRQDQLHPTQKPLALCEYLIRTYSDPGAVVLDHCMGSGTTAVACLTQGRRCIGVERDAFYHALAGARLRDAVESLVEGIPVADIGGLETAALRRERARTGIAIDRSLQLAA